MRRPMQRMNSPALPNVYRGNAGNVIFIFGIVMFLFFIASAYMLATARATYPIASVALSAVWVVGVPIFFFLEHVYLFRYFGNPDQYDQFKRLQELAGKIWAGAILVLAAFFTGETFPK